MNYIVDPMWFYWLDVISSTKGLAILLVIIFIICAIIEGIVWGVYKAGWLDCSLEQDKKVCQFIERKVFVPTIIVLIVSALIIVFLPSRETMITMMVAKYATYENAQLTVDTIKEVIDYIVKSIQSI